MIPGYLKRTMSGCSMASKLLKPVKNRSLHYYFILISKCMTSLCLNIKVPSKGLFSITSFNS